MLTQERIQQLAGKRGVRAIAVQNFLGSLVGMSLSDALANLEMDARSYRWNTATVSAIRTGILEHYRGSSARRVTGCGPCEARVRAAARSSREDDDRDRTEVTLTDDEALNLMPGWWGSMGDPLYAIHSMGGRHERWVFEHAISNLDSDIARVKKLGPDRYQLGKGTFSKKEIDELYTMRDALENAVRESRSGARRTRSRRSRGRRTCRGPRGQFRRC